MNGKEAEKFYRPTVDFEVYKKNLMSDEEYEARTFKSEFNHFMKIQEVTIKKLADRIGMEAKQLSRYSTGERKPDRLTVIRIALGLLLSVDDINRLLSSADYADLTVKKKDDAMVLSNYDKILDAIKKNDERQDYTFFDEFNEMMEDAGCSIIFELPY